MVPAKELLTDFLKRRAIVRAVAMKRGSGSGVHRQALLDAIPRPGYGILYRRRTNRPRHTRLPIMYAVMRRLRRGFYEVEFNLLWDGREVTPPNTVTERYARACEIDVLKSPRRLGCRAYRRWLVENGHCTAPIDRG